MNKKLIIHVGLPKTATTALQQHVFESGHDIYWNYLGVRQSRDRIQTKSYNQLIECISCSNTCIEEAFKKFKKLISLTKSDLPSLFSEEMILVDQRISWQEKIKRLQQITVDYDVTILVTVRNPTKAVFSLYAELYHQISNNYPSFDNFVKKSNQAKIFSYKSLFIQLEKKFNKKNIIPIPFELLESKKFIFEISQKLNIPFEITELPNENSHLKLSNGIISKSLTMKQWVNSTLNKRSYSTSYFIALICKFFRLSKSRINCPWGYTKIKTPDLNAYNEWFSNSNQWFLENYSIDYINVKKQL